MDKHLVQAIQHLSLALTKHKVDYMFVGGVAIAFYAQPRPSSNLPKGIDYDVDIWYRATSRNFVQLSEAILEISPELESDLKKSLSMRRRHSSSSIGKKSTLTSYRNSLLFIIENSIGVIKIEKSGMLKAWRSMSFQGRTLWRIKKESVVRRTSQISKT